MKVLRSDCCEQPVIVRSNYKFYSSNDDSMCRYECIKCQEQCNAIKIEVEERDDEDKV